MWTTVHKGTINLTVVIIIITGITDSRNSRNRKGEQSKQARKEGSSGVVAAEENLVLVQKLVVDHSRNVEQRVPHP
jgi:hypothetical protein